MLGSVTRCGFRSCAFRHAHSVRQRFISSSSSSKAPSTAADVVALQAEIQQLRTIVQEANALQSRNLERLAQQVEAQPQTVELRLRELIRSKLKDGSASPLDQVSAAARDYVRHNEALTKLLDQVNRQVHKYPNLINKYTVGGFLLSLVVIWRYWASIQKRTSKEVADLASQTLEQETLRKSIQETIDSLANSPETLHSLTRLLQSLIQDPATQQQLVKLIVYAAQTEQVQNALLDILQNVFKDPKLQELAGEFLLKGLDVESVKAMLDQQTQALVKRTVSDESVQRATGDGVRKSFWHAIIPFW